LQIAIRKPDQITIVDAVGDIDYSTSPELRKALLHEFCELKIPRVALNLTSVQYVEAKIAAPTPQIRSQFRYRRFCSRLWPDA
jgi:anti-anti-sigma regulatory factor